MSFMFTGHKGELLLRKLESKQAVPAAKPVLGTAPVSDTMREAGALRILEALRRSAAGQGMEDVHLAAAARVTLQTPSSGN